MPDYQGNSKRERADANVPPKKVERVILSEVIIPKKSIGRKFRDLFIEADFKTVARYVATDVLLPAARNMILDASTKGVERMLYGESAVRRRHLGMGPRITYNNPINRGYADSPSRESTMHYAPTQRIGAGTSIGPGVTRLSRDNFIISSREEGELVLERMNDIIDSYDVASVADLNDLVGLPTTHVDNKWGWTNLKNVPIRQVREGYLIDFPPAEAIG